MAKYRNSRIEAEMAEEEMQEEVQMVLDTPVESAEEKAWKQRYGDLRRHAQEKEAKLQDQIDQLQRQMEAISSGQMKAPKTKEDILKFKNAYPEFSEVFDVMVDEKVKELTKDIREQTNNVKKEKAALALRKLHPDMDDILDPTNTDFHEWLAKQSKLSQDAIYRNLNVEDAAFVIDKYKLTLNKKSNRDEDDFDARSAASAVKTKGRVDLNEEAGDFWFTESQIDAADMKWYEANEAKIAEAARKGKIKLDMTGGAR